MTPPLSSARAPTIADVAALAGVSKATAGRVLGGYGTASEHVRETVLAAAAHLGYRPNRVARSISTGRTQTVGAVVGNIENPYFSSATRGILDALADTGLDLLLMNTGGRVETERAAVRVLLDKRVDGVIVSPAHAAEVTHLREVVVARRPLLLLDRDVIDLDVPYDLVRSSSAATASELANHLAQLGHRRIAFLSSLRPVEGLPLLEGVARASTAIADRLSGLLDGLRSNGLREPERFVRFGVFSPETVERVLVELFDLEDGPTAIVTSDSLVALRVLESLRRIRKRVAEDVSLATFDDPVWAGLVTPAITAVAQPVYEVGRRAGDVIAARIAGTTPLPHPGFTPVLHLRESTAPPPFR